MSTRPIGYEIRVDGHLDDHWSERLGGLAITRDSDGTSTLRGAVVDQAQLQGALAGLRDIGATLLEVRPTGTSRAPARSAVTGTADEPGAAEPLGPVLRGPLRTERLTLRPATVEDTGATWAFRQLAPVNEWLTGTPDSIEGYRELFADPARLATTVVVQLGHGPAAPVIGDFTLRPEDAWAQLEVAEQARDAQAELGWVLDPAHAGHGYATEAVRALLRYCFEDLGVRRVVANCFLDNAASWRLMERVGMRREAHAVRESLHRSGAWLDTVSYALLRDEPAAQVETAA